MGDSSSHHPTQSRMRLRNAGGGEIVEVQGGHIVRSIGRKDRHSKVCTAKGPRDRRVRLAAHTAIQFYDVQDRLGYDRPSKAVDWLINKAKAAIDELAHLPPWHPTLCSDQPKQLDEPQQQQHQFVDRSDLVNDNPSDENAQSSSFVPPSLDSDAIADTIKSFFPTSGASSAEASSSAMQFSDLLSRNGNNSQDLRLSLQSFQDPILLHHHNHQSQSQSYSEAQALLSATPLGFESWAEHHHQQVAELSRLQRLPPWAGSGSGDSAGGAGYLQQLLGQNQFVSQRGPLQSSNTPSIRAWMDPSAIAIAADDHRRPAIVPIYPSSMAGIGCIAGFHIPTRIQGNEEHDSYSDKPSSASSESRH